MPTFDRYRNISLSLKMKICRNGLSCIRLVLNEVSGGNQSVCRISILIEEMLEWVESLDTLDSTGRYWIVLEGAGTCSNACRAGMS